MTPVRLAGSVRLADGTVVTWTVAEGRKGRRWREVQSDERGAVHWSLLYETDPDGRFAHLELASASGLATLHPERDGTLHGNVVEPDGGVRHVAGEPFDPGTALVVGGSRLAGAAVARGHAVGDPTVVLDPATLTLTRRSLEPGDLTAVDADGAPMLDYGSTWPLET